MKLPIIILTILFVQCSDSKSIWFPSVFDTITNKTTALTNYVRETGRSFKDFYIENVRNKINHYFGKGNATEATKAKKHYDTGKYNYDAAKQNRIKRKFKEYIDQAENENTPLFEAIAPETLGYNCVDDDPAIHMTTPQLIALHGYPAESHTVVTDDGYILTLHRIPFAKNDTSKISPWKTVLLHHGLLGSSADWILTGPEKGLGFILSEAGYDVWFANVRGNTYSRAHISRNIDTFAFWNFTFHEVSQYDLPAVIDYIMEIKGWDLKINYIGHSMGTTVLFAMLSTKPQYNKILRAGFALAPVAYMSDIRSPIHLLARFSDNIEYLLKLLGANEFLPQNSVLRWLSKHACEINHWEEAICENSLFVLCGHDEKQFNQSLLPIILGHTPAGASTKTLVHYAQEIKNRGKFQMFDYGLAGNLQQYGTGEPPQYPVERITLPIALFSSQNDWFSSDIDVTNLYVHLANPIAHYVVPLKEFNHLDFLYAIDAPTLVYNELLQLLEEGVAKTYHGDIKPNVVRVSDDDESVEVISI